MKKPVAAYPINVDGTPLEQKTDLNSPLGFFYRRSEGNFRTSQCFDRPAIVFPRFAAQVDVECRHLTPPIRVDGYAALIIPAHTTFDVTSATHDGNFFIGVVSSYLIHETARLFEIAKEDAFDAFTQLSIVRRSNWLNELIHRLVFERTVTRARISTATRFLEPEIVKETYYAIRNSRLPLPFDAAPDWGHAILNRAVSLIELNLYKRLSLSAIARHCKVSDAEITRIFEDTLSIKPLAFIEKRKLEEAIVMLDGEGMSLDVVSKLLGFAKSSAFSQAFKKQYGMTPSELLEKKS